MWICHFVLWEEFPVPIVCDYAKNGMTDAKLTQGWCTVCSGCFYYFSVGMKIHVCFYRCTLVLFFLFFIAGSTVVGRPIFCEMDHVYFECNMFKKVLHGGFSSGFHRETTMVIAVRAVIITVCITRFYTLVQFAAWLQHAQLFLQQGWVMPNFFTVIFLIFELFMVCNNLHTGGSLQNYCYYSLLFNSYNSFPLSPQKLHVHEIFRCL